MTLRLCCRCSDGLWHRDDVVTVHPHTGSCPWPMLKRRMNTCIISLCVCAVQIWKGRRLDVIVATTREKNYVAESAQDRDTSGLHLRRFSRFFWRQFLLTVGLAFAKDASVAEWITERGDARYLRFFTENGEAADLPAEDLALVDAFVARMGDFLCSEDMRSTTFATICKFDRVDNPVQKLRNLLVWMAKEGQLPADLVTALFEGPEGPSFKYVRCVAVATWPPAWLKQQQGDTAAASSGISSSGISSSDGGDSSSNSSSSSSSGDVVWVADADKLEESATGRAPHSQAQAALWYNHSLGLGLRSYIPGVTDDFKAQVGKPCMLQRLYLL